MKILLVLTGLLIFGFSMFAQSTPHNGVASVKDINSLVAVTFRVNMGAQIARNTFTVGVDSVYVRGDFQTTAGDPGNWGGNTFKALPATPADSIYKVTASFPLTAIGSIYNYKFVINGTNWESVNNRVFTLDSSNMTLPAYYFNNDTNRTPLVILTINFYADLSNLFSAGFNPASDSITVQGLDWQNGTLIPPVIRKMVPDTMFPAKYLATLKIKGVSGDTISWKYKAYPDSHFANSGWEFYANNLIAFPTASDTINISGVPRILIGAPFLYDKTVHFEANFNGAGPFINAKNGQIIPVSQIDFVGIKGGSLPIGNWFGSWKVSDTIAPATLITMNDLGLFGDNLAGDKIWSRDVFFPSGTPGDIVEFKYAAHYPGADTAGGGISPLDNEGGSSSFHTFFFDNLFPGNINVGYHFGNFTENGITEISDSKEKKTFSLAQNYPNPFNPSTKINFVIPQDGFVTLRVFNIIGEEVGLLIHKETKAGAYEVSFDGSPLSSGVYFYKLKVGNFTATRKMILIK